MKRFRVEHVDHAVVFKPSQGMVAATWTKGLGWRTWCPGCPGDGYTYASSWGWAMAVVRTHLKRHAPWPFEYLGPGLVDLGWVSSDGLTMESDEDETLQFRG